eukprot:1759786-Amphidinium_carterae.1
MAQFAYERLSLKGTPSSTHAFITNSTPLPLDCANTEGTHREVGTELHARGLGAIQLQPLNKNTRSPATFALMP